MAVNENRVPSSASFEYQLNCGMAPISKYFSLSEDASPLLGKAKRDFEADGLNTEEVNQPLSSSPRDPQEYLKAVGYDVQLMTDWKKEVQSGLQRAGSVTHKLNSVKVTLQSILEGLACVEAEDIFMKPDQSSAHPMAESDNPSPTNRTEWLTNCISQVTTLCDEISSAPPDPTTIRFGTLTEQFHNYLQLLKNGGVSTVQHNGLIQRLVWAFDLLYSLPVNFAVVAINELQNGYLVTSELDAAFAKESLSLQRDRKERGGGKLYTEEEANIRRDKWRSVFESMNTAFLSKMESNAPLRRLIEFLENTVKKDVVEFGIPSNSSITPVLNAYSRVRLTSFVKCLRYFFANSKIPAPQTKEQEESAEAVGELYDLDLAHLVEELTISLEAFLSLEKGVLESVWLSDDFIVVVLPQLSITVTDEAYALFRSQLLCVDEVTELSSTIESVEAIRHHYGRKKWLDLSSTWVRMIQDTQERLIFRASVYVKKNLAAGGPTKAWAEKFRSMRDETVEVEYLPSFVNSVTFLKSLHRTLVCAIFSVLAEEVIRLCLSHASQLSRLMKDLKPSDPMMTLVTELSHLHYLHHTISTMDGQVKVVEKKLDVRQLLLNRKIRVIESSRESMDSVENRLAACYQSLVDHLTQCVDEAGRARTEESLADVQKLTSVIEKILFRFIPDQWLRAKVLLPVYQCVERYKGP